MSCASPEPRPADGLRNTVKAAQPVDVSGISIRQNMEFLMEQIMKKEQNLGTETFAVGVDFFWVFLGWKLSFFSETVDVFVKLTLMGCFNLAS